MNSELELKDFDYKKTDAKVLKLALIHEGLDIEIDATATLGRPALMRQCNGDPGHPAEPPEIDEWIMHIINPKTKEKLMLDYGDITNKALERLEQEFWDSLNVEPDEE